MHSEGIAIEPIPTAGAEELLREHGVPWEEEILSHSLSPVPEEEEERPRPLHKGLDQGLGQCG